MTPEPVTPKLRGQRFHFNYRCYCVKLAFLYLGGVWDTPLPANLSELLALPCLCSAGAAQRAPIPAPRAPGSGPALSGARRDPPPARAASPQPREDARPQRRLLCSPSWEVPSAAAAAPRRAAGLLAAPKAQRSRAGWVLQMKAGAGRGQSSSPSCPQRAAPLGRTGGCSCSAALGKLRRPLSHAEVQSCRVASPSRAVCTPGTNVAPSLQLHTQHQRGLGALAIWQCSSASCSTRNLHLTHTNLPAFHRQWTAISDEGCTVTHECSVDSMGYLPHRLNGI